MRTALVTIIFSALVHAQVTLNVPSGFATIQSAVNAAVDGDTVLVAPGTWVGDTVIIDKRITVRSSGGPDVTTLIGTGITTPQRPVIAAHAGNKIIGFTITGGTGVRLPAGLYNFTPNILGGGVYLSGASSSGAQYMSELRDCIIRGNTTDPGGDPTVCLEGGGVLVGGPGQFVIADCTIEGNTALHLPGSPAFNFGGGIFAWGDGVIERCVIRGNAVDGPGGGIFVASSLSSVVIRDCIVEGNSAEDGGAIFWGNDAGPIERCILRGNVATGSGGGIAANSTMTLRDTLIVGNTAAVGGGLHVMATSGAPRIDFTSCTVAANVAGSGSGGGLYFASAGSIDLDHSILWGNVPDQLAGASGAAITASAAWSDVQGGVVPGPGVFDADPAFFAPASGDYRLTQASPCRDAGDPAATPGGVDFEGDPRGFNGIADVGADEFFGLGACATSAAAGASGPFDVLTINGSTGGPDRRVVVRSGDTFTLLVDQPPLNPNPAPFLLSGFIGVPLPAQATALPFGLGTLCFPSALLTPGDPGAFTVTSSYGPIPGQLAPSHPAPWALAGVAPPLDFAVTLQGLINHLPATPVLTNGIVLEFRD